MARRRSCGHARRVKRFHGNALGPHRHHPTPLNSPPGRYRPTLLGVDRAFGGALALAYYTDPRSTVDVDLNIFVAVGAAAPVVAAFAALGFTPESTPERWMPAAGVRLVAPGEIVRLDLFFSLDAAYDEIAGRTRWFPFGAARRELPFLSAEDLVTFKLSFGRDKDWVDLRRLAEATPGLDLTYVERQLLALRGPPMYPRLARLRAMTQAR